MVLIACGSNAAGHRVLELVELCLQQVLGLIWGGKEGKPALVIRVSNAICWDPVVDEPALDLGDGLVRWRECFDDLFGAPVFSVVLRFWVGSISIAIF
jgi:hypothetical protein